MLKITKILSLAFLLTLTVLSSCTKKEEQGFHKVTFKAVGTSGVSVSTALYVDGTGNTENFTSLSGNTWTSVDYTIPASAMTVNFGAQATGPEAASTLTVEIWVDGEKKAEGKSTGRIMSASANYNFKN